MAKGGNKLSKMLKKVQSMGRHTPPAVARPSLVSSIDRSSRSVDDDLHPVYVGKARRRYLVGSAVLEHPLFRELVTSDGSDHITVGCEVVLFEHLLWMLDNADPHPDSLHELVDFYACS